MTDAPSIKAKLRTSRRMSITLRPAIKKHATKIGEIAWAWNSLHSQFLYLFMVLADPNDGRVGLTIWHSISSDKGQREMLVDLAKYRLSKKPKLLSSLIWATNNAGELSGLRNAFVHAPVSYKMGPDGNIDAMVHSLTATPKHVIKLGSVDMRKLYRLLRGDLIHLDQYLTGLYFCLTREQLYSLPKRPSLLSPALFRQSNSQKHHHRRKPAHRPRPSTSS